MMGISKRRLRRRNWLLERYPYCPMCGAKMIAPKPGEKNNHPHVASLEHLNSKVLPEDRLRKSTKEEQAVARKYRLGRTILLCRKCNSISGLDDVPIELYWDLVWKDAGRFPSGIRGRIKILLNEIIKIL